MNRESNSHPMHKSTAAIHAGNLKSPVYGEVSVPIFQSSTFAFPNADEGAARFSGEKPGFIYSRMGFSVYGKSIYPDATFTLRLAYGTVKGYEMNGTVAPYKTTLFGVYDRTISFDKDGEFFLSERFWERQELLNFATPVNFVSTCDIIGGNSGSPVINKDAEIVGLIFDGNIESLCSRFVYDEKNSRAVSVHSAYIMEALRKLYDANILADEIEEIGTW